MKTVLLILTVGSAIMFAGCADDKVVYHHVYHHHHQNYDSGYTTPGHAEHISEHNSPEEFHAATQPQ